MFFKKKTAVYLSSDEADFNEARNILDKEHIKYYEFVSEEMPMVCCGAGIKPSRFNRNLELMVYRLSVVSEDVEKAIRALQGNVKFVVEA